MSKFFCDTNCELWYTKAKELGLNVIRMPYNIGNDEFYYDLGENTDFVNFFNRIRNGEIPKTSALNEEDYREYFEPVLAGGDDILYVHFSSQMSGTFQSMKVAIEKLIAKYPDRKINTVDTMAISLCAGSIVHNAAKLWKNGATDEEIIKWVEDNRLHFAGYFVVDDLNHLKRGGRISATTAFMGSMLGIKPLLNMSEEGKIEKIGTAKGFKNGVIELFNKLKSIGENVADYDIYILQADNLTYANYLYKLVRDYVGENANIEIQFIGPVIGTHCGPGTIGLIFHSKKR